MLEYLKSVLVGIIEGITEWLPVSSTGHMILFDEFFPFKKMTPEFYPVFLYVIQLGAILAVICMYFNRLNPFSCKKSREEKRSALSLWGKVLVGVIPAGIAGLLLDDWLDGVLTDSGIKALVVAIALVAYGIIFIVIERLKKGKENKIESVEDLSYKTAFFIGIFQVLSIVPGTSRSGSTIIGGITLGVSRTASAEFSFFMSIPIMLGVSVLKIGKYAIECASGEAVITGTDIGLLAVGFIVAFVVSLIAIKFLMEFVRKHSFEAFGWYRIVIGFAVLAYFIFK